MPPTNHPAVTLFNGAIESREDRSLNKQLRGLQSSISLELAHVQAAEVVEQAKIVALEATGHVALSSAASIVEHRRFRIEQNPDGVAAINDVTERDIRAIGDRIDALNRRLGS
jgi:hypothetical protein